MNQEQLMEKIRQTGFALVDTNLFLDTHPTCQMALDFFAENQKMYRQYVSEYERNYGPLTPGSTDVSRGWQWTQGPWPWELEG
ncbi:MAG: spore coat protein CotJB [Firmicutes bacterium]|nr:spore coat protein CotJB [Bacillota bacterium]